jgi:hypothetical protein
MTVAMAVVSQRLHPLPYDVPRIAGCSALFILFLVGSYYLEASSFLLTMVEKLTFVGSYIAALFATKVIRWEDLLSTAAILTAGTPLEPSMAAES